GRPCRRSVCTVGSRRSTNRHLAALLAPNALLRHSTSHPAARAANACSNAIRLAQNVATWLPAQRHPDASPACMDQKAATLAVAADERCAGVELLPPAPPAAP